MCGDVQKITEGLRVCDFTVNPWDCDGVYRGNCPYPHGFSGNELFTAVLQGTCQRSQCIQTGSDATSLHQNRQYMPNISEQAAVISTNHLIARNSELLTLKENLTCG